MIFLENENTNTYSLCTSDSEQGYNEDELSQTFIYLSLDSISSNL